MYEGKPVSLSVNRDITERKKMEEQLREAPGAPSRKSKVGEGTTFTVVIPKEKTRRRDKNESNTQ
jgi:predicted thioesterase